MNLLLMNAKTRYALLKKELREIVLEKNEPGYKARYFYISLQEMQRIIVPLEVKYGLTSEYTEERLGNNNEIVMATRTLKDLQTEKTVTKTAIDITNLKIMSDAYKIGADVLQIPTPKDATDTLLYEFFEPQTAGSISTYFQRYTYNQLYDFQETKEDAIEVKGRLKDRQKEEEAEERVKELEPDAPVKKRIQDDGAEIRGKIKAEFERKFIIKVLNGRKLNGMNKKEALDFYNELIEEKNKEALTEEKTENKTHEEDLL